MPFCCLLLCIFSTMAPANSTSVTSSGKGMLVAIDSAVENYDFLEANVLPGAKTVVLSGRQDAITQITAALYDPFDNRMPPFDSIHIIAPGSPGILHFSSGDFSLKTLRPHTDRIQTWFAADVSATVARSLEPQLLLYGRRVGAGQSGTELIDTLSWLSGATVIAAKNGDRWPSLNREVAELAFPLAVQQSYQGTFSI